MSPGKLSVFICGRDRRPTCSVCHEPNSVVHHCGFPLMGAMADKICERGLCGRCAVRMDLDKFYCPPHARFEVRRSTGQNEDDEYERRRELIEERRRSR